MSIRIAVLRGTARESATIGVEQNSPIRTPGVPNRADSAATARSQVATSWQPAAVATPWTAAMTGCGIDWMSSMSSEQRVKISCCRAWSAPRISLRSCPEQNTCPAVESTTACTSVRSPIAVSASMSAPITGIDSALRVGAASIMTRATAPSTVTVTGASVVAGAEAVVAVSFVMTPV